MSDELVERFRTIPPATIGHLLAEGFMDTALRPIFGPISVVGSCVTQPESDNAVTAAIDNIAIRNRCRTRIGVSGNLAKPVRRAAGVCAPSVSIMQGSVSAAARTVNAPA